jgi:hypothetical protein
MARRRERLFVARRRAGTMSRDTMSSLHAIQSMLAAGHRNICLRSHTLLLWGVTGGILCLSLDYILTPERFPDMWLRHLALLFLLTVVLSGVALSDYGLTRHRLQQLDESMSFTQSQITKVWWLLTGMGVLFSFASGMYGGGAMTYGIWLLLVGIGLYVHGLFSDQVLEWAGALVIALGAGALVLRIGYLPMKWLAASTFGIGLPSLSPILDRGAERPVSAKLVRIAAWLCAVLLLPVLGYYSIDRTVAPANGSVLEFPAGTVIPFKLRMKSDALQVDRDAQLPMKLAQPLRVAIDGVKPDGRFQLQGRDWKRFPYDVRIHVEGFSAELEQGKSPAIIVDMQVDTSQ